MLSESLALLLYHQRKCCDRRKKADFVTFQRCFTYFILLLSAFFVYHSTTLNSLQPIVLFTCLIRDCYASLSFFLQVVVGKPSIHSHVGNNCYQLVPSRVAAYL